MKVTCLALQDGSPIINGTIAFKSAKQGVPDTVFNTDGNGQFLMDLPRGVWQPEPDKVVTVIYTEVA